MPTPQKAQIIDEVTDSFGRAKSVFLADFTGLTVEEMTELRRSFRQAGVEFRVVKNTLARMAAEKSSYGALSRYFEGPTALALAMQDPAAPARIILEYRKKKEKPHVKAFVFEGQMLDPSQLEAIAELPPREVIIGHLLAGLNSPIVRLVGVLQGLLSDLVHTLDAIREKREKEQPAPRAEEVATPAANTTEPVVAQA